MADQRAAAKPQKAQVNNAKSTFRLNLFAVPFLALFRDFVSSVSV